MSRRWPRYPDAPIVVDVNVGPKEEGHYMDCACGALMRFVRVKMSQSPTIDFCDECGQHYLIQMIENEGK